MIYKRFICVCEFVIICVVQVSAIVRSWISIEKEDVNVLIKSKLLIGKTNLINTITEINTINNIT